MSSRQTRAPVSGLYCNLLIDVGSCFESEIIHKRSFIEKREEKGNGGWERKKKRTHQHIWIYIVHAFLCYRVRSVKVRMV